MRPQIVLVTFFLAVLPLSAIPAIGRGTPAGAWEPIEDVHSELIRGLAQFAVFEFDQKNHTNLIFKDVVRGETYDVDYVTTKYCLHLLTDRPSSPCYQAVVQVQTWSLHSWELLSFEGEIC